jgi:hypothetical protein
LLIWTEQINYDLGTVTNSPWSPENESIRGLLGMQTLPNMARRASITYPRLSITYPKNAVDELECGLAFWPAHCVADTPRSA